MKLDHRAVVTASFTHEEIAEVLAETVRRRVFTDNVHGRATVTIGCDVQGDRVSAEVRILLHDVHRGLCGPECVPDEPCRSQRLRLEDDDPRTPLGELPA